MLRGLGLLLWAATVHGACVSSGAVVRHTVSGTAIEPSYTGLAQLDMFEVPVGHRLRINTLYLSGTNARTDVGCYGYIAAHTDPGSAVVGSVPDAYPQRLLGIAMPPNGMPVSLTLTGLDLIVNHTYSGGRGEVYAEDSDYQNGQPCALPFVAGFTGCLEGPVP